MLQRLILAPENCLEDVLTFTPADFWSWPCYSHLRPRKLLHAAAILVVHVGIEVFSPCFGVRLRQHKSDVCRAVLFLYVLCPCPARLSPPASRFGCAAAALTRDGYQQPQAAAVALQVSRSFGRDTEIQVVSGMALHNHGLRADVDCWDEKAVTRVVRFGRQ